MRDGSTSTRHPEREESQDVPRRVLPIVIGYVIAILIGLRLPVPAVAIYFGIAPLAVPFQKIAGMLRHHRQLA
jgi:hypothetical protein